MMFYSSYLTLHHGSLWVDEVIHQCVNSVLLVIGNRAHCLLTHGALIRVTRRLVVMWVRYEACADAEQRKRLYLQVRSRPGNRIAGRREWRIGKLPS